MSAFRSLVILGLLITAGGFTSDLIGDYVGPIEYKGYLVFDYPEGENPINNIVFYIDSTIADNLIIVSVPSPWIYAYSDGVLTLTGGSVDAGGSISVTVSLNKYFEDGEYQVSSVGTTTTGEVSQAVGPLLVGELFLLYAIALASLYKYPLVGLTVGVGFLDVFLSNRARTGKHIADAVDPIVNGAPDGKSPTVAKIDLGTQHSMYPPGEDPSELFRDLTGADEVTSDGSKNHSFPLGGGSNVKWAPLSEKALDNLDNFGKARTPEEIAKKIGDSFIPETDKSDSPKTGDETPKTTKETSEIKNDPDNPDQKDEDMSGASDLADYELYKSPSDRAKELSLEEREGVSNDSIEYDDSDLPGLDEIPDPPLTDPVELDDSDLSGLKTLISGKIESTVPTIIGTTINVNEAINASLLELGLSMEDLLGLTDYRVDFTEPPQETTINEIKITPLLSGEGTIQPDLIPRLSPKFDDAPTSIPGILTSMKGIPLKPLIRQSMDNEGLPGESSTQSYRMFYKPTESYDGVILVDLNGTPLIGTGEGGVLVEFDPIGQNSQVSDIPFLSDFLVNELHLTPESSKPLETIIMLDVKLAPTVD